MVPFDLLAYATSVAESMGLRYFVTGSMATILYGETRFTNDIDMVIDLADDRVAEFCARFPSADFYVSESAAREAIRTNGQFDILVPTTGFKVDVVIPAKSPFNESRFRRTRRLRTPNNFDAQFASPEDVILKKLEYHKLGESDKHLRDIASVLKISGATIDREYLDQWAQQLGLERELRKVTEASSESS